jgi:hypothetical protein
LESRRRAVGEPSESGWAGGKELAVSTQRAVKRAVKRAVGERGKEPVFRAGDGGCSLTALLTAL